MMKFNQTVVDDIQNQIIFMSRTSSNGVVMNKLLDSGVISKRYLKFYVPIKLIFIHVLNLIINK